ncbi:MAG TPA: NADP-dependent phosphogluconate dehydrogenase, partial [Cytophagales bacterium]|nr:NADP-dependent phosphogluconate dehydrogenase [Cytophagales bacterium]
MDKQEFGLAGLGVMGKSLARNLGRNGVRLSLYNRYVPITEEKVAERAMAEHGELANALGFEEIAPFVTSLAAPRKIFLMVPAGAATGALIKQMLPHLDTGDILIDGGNAHYQDTERRIKTLQNQGIQDLGTGVSGGEKGALEGPAIMPSGDEAAYAAIAPYLERIAAKDQKGTPCSGHIGRGGAGHFVKMIHNGVEYAEMQLLAELVYLLKHHAHLEYPAIADVLTELGERGAQSYLLEITINILRATECETYLLDTILDKSGNKGTGGWSTVAAAEYGYPASMIATALFARYTSARKTERVAREAQYSLPRRNFEASTEALFGAYQISRIVNHHQGFQLINEANTRHDWGIRLPEVARIWTNGCIIRSSLMESLIPALETDTSLLAHPELASFTQALHSSLVQVCNAAS